MRNPEYRKQLNEIIKEKTKVRYVYSIDLIAKNFLDEDTREFRYNFMKDILKVYQN
jgi:hypothetical protein